MVFSWAMFFCEDVTDHCFLAGCANSSLFTCRRASFRLGFREPWSTVRTEHRAFGGILCLFRSDWSLRQLDVCICTDASEKGFAFVKDAASWPQKLVVSQSGHGSREAPGPSVTDRALIAPVSIWIESSGSDGNEVSLARRESRADFPKVSHNFWIPTEWKLAANEKENIMVLEARSILYAVRYARVTVLRDAS